MSEICWSGDASIWASNSARRCISSSSRAIFSLSRVVPRGERLCRFVPVGRVELLEITCHALLNLSAAALDLGAREVAIAVVHGFELGAVNRHAGGIQQAQLAAEGNEPGTDLPDGPAAILAKVGDGLVIGSQASGEPHQLDIAASLALQSAARLHPVEIAVDVELEQDGGMVRRTASST